MSKSYVYESRWVVSSVDVAESGVATEISGFREGTVHAEVVYYVPPGTVFPSIGAWITAMDAETARRAPWACTLGPGEARAKRQHKLSAIDSRSSVVWVESAGHYMEVRRGSQTKFTGGERRTWATVDEWLASLMQSEQPTTAAVKEETVAAAPVLVVAEVSAAPHVVTAKAPAVVAFDAEKFKETWAQLRDLTRKETGMLRSTYVIQLCQFLLDSRPAAADWLAVNPVWRYTVRAIVQELGWQGAAHEAVAAFLEKF